MYSKYERQKDARSYGQRQVLYTGPQYLSPPERILPMRTITWGDDGLPLYTSLGEGEEEGGQKQEQEQEAAPAAPEEEVEEAAPAPAPEEAVEAAE